VRTTLEKSSAESEHAQPVAASDRDPAGRSITVIRPREGWSLGLGELWEFRELLYFFGWRDVKVRYRQAAFGAAWAIIQPLMFMVVFSVFLGRLAGVSSDGLPYPVFTFAALVPWTLFSSALTSSSQSVVSSSQLVSKVYFPRLALPVGSVGSFLLDFVIAFGILLGMMTYYGIHPSGRFVWLPALVALTLVVALAVGIGLAALNVRYRDVRYVLPFLVQLWLFASPVAYSTSLVPDSFRAVYGLNPMAGIIEGFRWTLLGTGDAPSGMFAVSAAVAVLLFVVSCVYFKRTEAGFADVI
jgi:lipopolysaccharide transport system permease protein